jgi:hypothetical protein
MRDRGGFSAWCILSRATCGQVIDGPFRGTVVNCVPSGAGASPRQPQAKKKAVREGPAGLIAIDAAHVLEAAGSSQSHNGDSGGRGDAARGELPFGWGDQSERAAVLRKGDVVSFAVVVDRPSKTRSASARPGPLHPTTPHPTAKPPPGGTAASCVRPLYR